MISWPSSDTTGDVGWDGIVQLQQEIAATGGLDHMQMKDISGDTWFWTGYTLIPIALLTYEFAKRQTSPDGKSPFQHMKLVGLDPIEKRAARIDGPEDVIALIAQGGQPALWMGEAPTQETMAQKQLIWHERMQTNSESLALQEQLGDIYDRSDWPDRDFWLDLTDAYRQLDESTPYVHVQGPRLLDTTALIWAGYTVISPALILAEIGTRVANPDRETPLRDHTLLAIDPYEQQADLVQSAADYVTALAHGSVFAIYLPGPEPTRAAMRETQNELMLSLLFGIRQLIADISSDSVGKGAK